MVSTLTPCSFRAYSGQQKQNLRMDLSAGHTSHHESSAQITCK